MPDLEFACRRAGVSPLVSWSARTAAANPFLRCAAAAFVLVWVGRDVAAESESAASPHEAAAHPEGAIDADDEAETVGAEVIVVTGTRTPTPLATSPVVTEVVARDAIEASGARTVAGALATRPGVWIERGIGGAGVSLEGLGPEYVLILVDGQRQIGRVGGAIDLDRLGTAGVEQIEIVRGPGSALYGADALGGVVNIVTRPPGDGAEVSARVDSRRARDLTGRLSAGAGDWSGTVSGAWRTGDAFDRTPAEPSTTIAAYDDARGAAQGRYQRGDWRVDGNVDYLRRDLAGVSATATGAVLDRRNLTEVATARAASQWSGDRTVVRSRIGAALFRDQYRSDQRGADALDQYQETRERELEVGADADRRLGDRHRITAGGELLAEALTTPRLARSGRRLRAALFAQDEWRLGDQHQLLVVPALRLDHDSQFGGHATPRLAVRWDASERIVARASVGAGYRAPGFKELLLHFENPGVGYVVDGNPDLAPETSESVHAGGEWRPRSWLWLAGNAFDNELHDLIAAVSVDGGDGPMQFRYQNVGRARTSGVEATAAVAAGRLGVELGAAWTRARDLDGDRPLEGVPALRVAAAVRWRDRGDGFDAAVEGAITGPRPYYPTDLADWTSPRAELRARVAKRFTSGVGFTLGADNLLGAGDDRYDPLPPPTLYVGVDVRR